MTLAEPFTLNVNPHFAELMSAPLDVRRKAYEDQAWRDEALTWWDTATGLIPRWDTYEIMESTANPDLVGRRLLALADERGVDPFDLLLDLTIAETDLRQIRVKAVLANDDQDGIAVLLQADVAWYMTDTGADGAAITAAQVWPEPVVMESKASSSAQTSSCWRNSSAGFPPSAGTFSNRVGRPDPGSLRSAQRRRHRGGRGRPHRRADCR